MLQGLAAGSIVILMGGAFAHAAAPAQSAQSHVLLKPGQEIDLPLRSKATLTLGFAECATRYMEVEVSERGLDVSVGLEGVGDKPLTTNDMGIPRHGVHRLAFAVDRCDALHLAITTNSLEQSGGTVHVSVARVWPDLPADNPDLALALRETAAVQDRDGGEEQTRELAGRWESLATEWEQRDHASRGAEAWFRAGTLRARANQRLLAEPDFKHAVAAATKADAHRLTAWAWNDLGMNYWHQGESRRADLPLQNAQRESAKVDDPLLSAIVLNNLCLTQNLRDDIAEAKRCYRRALKLSLATRDSRRIATALNNLGGASWLDGDVEAASSLFQKSLKIRNEIGDRHGKADSTLNLGLIRLAEGHPGEAVQNFQDALADYRQTGDLRMQGSATLQLGRAEALLGRSADALALLEQAAQIFEQTHSNDLMLGALISLASLQVLPDQRRKTLDRARAIAAIDAVPYDVADVELAWAHERLASGDAAAAAPAIDRAAELAERIDSGPMKIQATLERARLALARNDAAAVQGLIEPLLGVTRQRLPPMDLSDALGLVAKAAVVAKDDSRADVLLGEAETTIEAVRTRIVDPETRARFLATRKALLGDHIDLLMRLSLAPSGTASADRAFALSDRMRAQSLLEEIQASRDSEKAAHDPRIARINSLSLARVRLHGEDKAKLDEVDRHIADLERDLALGRLTRKEAAPRSRAIAVDIDTVRRQLDSDTSVLYFSIGQHGAYAWLLSSQAQRIFYLGDPAAIDASARRISEAIRNASDAGLQTALADTGRLLAAPLAAVREHSRLVVIPDGALHFVPFAALPYREAGTALIDAAELSVVPSAALFLKAQERTFGGVERMLLVADPVFRSDDARLARDSALASNLPQGEPEVVRSTGLDRLYGSALEIERIAGVAPPNIGLTRLSGFDASRERVLAALDDPHSIVHFATHGLVDANYPDASGLVLSLFTPSGAPSDGFVGMSEIVSHRLSAHLVVLSACRTAAGPEIPGEGPWGLTQAFLIAGAGTVVSSLWEVPDQATVELMAEFYRSLFDGNSATFALRAAQQHLRSSVRFRAPRYWAAFRATGRFVDETTRVDGAL